MERRSFLKKLLMVPVAAAISTELLFNAVVAESPIARMFQHVEVNKPLGPRNLFRDENGHKWYAIKDNVMMLLSNDPEKTAPLPTQLNHIGNAYPELLGSYEPTERRGEWPGSKHYPYVDVETKIIPIIYP